MKRLLAYLLAVQVVVGGLAGVTIPASAHAKDRPKAPQGGARAAAMPTSFKAPVDFATGAIPSSAEFNKRYGDQLLLQGVHLSLLDSVATGDFDRDGDTDAVQTNVLAGSISIFLGDGKGRFAPPVVRPVGINPNFVAAGDLDGDNNLDLVIADTGANGVSILRGDGKGGFLTIGFLPVPLPRNVVIGRIDGGAVPDLAVASAGPVCPRLAQECMPGRSTGGVHTFVGLGAGAFRPSQLIPLTHSNSSRVGANAVALHDFNGDGLGDLAATVGTSTWAFDRPEPAAKPTGDDLLVFLNREDVLQPFALAPDQPALRIGGTPDAIAVGDWNRDTHPDLAVLENGSGSITTLLGSARGHFSVKASNPSVGTVPRGLTVGDFGGDGILDLATAGFASSTVSVLEGKGDGTFQPAVDHWAGDAPTGVAVGHFDGDRRLDLVVGRLRGDQMTLLTNDGPKSDGVVIHRDLSYGSPTDKGHDPYATRHTLDVYVPAKGTAPFAGSGRAYPVVIYAHGGGGISNNKTFHSLLMRRLAAQGIVAVSINYRLGHNIAAGAELDGAQAFRWIRDNIGSYGGNPRNMVLFGYSAGAVLFDWLATYPKWGELQPHIRALVLIGNTLKTPGPAAKIPESLLLSGDEEGDAPKTCDAYAAESNKRGTKSTHVNVVGRNHLTNIANLAQPTDPGRVALDRFLREQMNR